MNEGTKLPLWLVEYYVKNPADGTTGWDIKFAWVRAEGNAAARAKVAAADPNFDVIIEVGQQSQVFPLLGVTDPLHLE